MTIVDSEDKRNTEWRYSSTNVGSKLLSKMGWSEGDGIGKRNKNVTALRAVRRQVGLGIGAQRQSEGGNSESTATFANVLKNLQAHHNNNNSSNSDDSSSDERKRKKKKKDKKKKDKKNTAIKAKRGLALPQNKVLAGHARKMRAAKFGAKSQADMACIFGNANYIVQETASAPTATSSTRRSTISIKAPATTRTTAPQKLPIQKNKDHNKKKRRRDDNDDDASDDVEEHRHSTSSSSSSSDKDNGAAKNPTTVTAGDKNKKVDSKRKKKKKKQKSSSSSSSDPNTDADANANANTNVDTNETKKKKKKSKKKKKT